MARKYAIDGLPGLAGNPQTHVDGVVIPAGDPLPVGTTEFDLTYWYRPTPADIAAGAAPNSRLMIAVQNIPTSTSNAEVRRAIMQARALNRTNQNFGSDSESVSFA